MSEQKVITAPHSKDSEMMVLGCILTNPKALKTCCKLLVDRDFYFQEHKLVLDAILSLSNKNNGVDVHLICEELKKQDTLKAVGGVAYITTLAQYAATAAYIDEYLETLKEYSNRRKLLDLAVSLQKKALSDEDSKKIILSAQEHLRAIEKNKGARDGVPFRFLNDFEENFLLVEPKKKAMLLEYANAIGISSGFIPKGIVAMLVGAGGVGKTHLLAQLAVSVATGTPFLNTFTTTKHCGSGGRGNVFLGLGENQYDDIHRLLFKATKHLRKQQTNIFEENILGSASKKIAALSFCGQQASFIEDSKPSRYFREFKMRLEEMAPEEGWTLIILDPVSRLMGADAELDNAAATQFIALLEELTIELPGNPTVLFAHHTNKASLQPGANQNQSAARGASALTDGVRWQCNYMKDQNSDLATLKMTKSNFTPLLKEIKTKKDHDGFIEKLSYPSFSEQVVSPKTTAKKGGSSSYLAQLGIGGIADD